MSQLALGPCPGDKAAQQVKRESVISIRMKGKDYEPSNHNYNF